MMMAGKTTLSLELKAIGEAQQRARKAFFLSLVASSIVLICAFNVLASQNRNQPQETKYSAEEYKLRLKSWLERWSYSVPLVGISVSLEDFSLFGPLSLFVFSFYYVSCSRNALLQVTNLSLRKTWTDLELRKARIALTSEVVLNTSTGELASNAGISNAVARGSLQGINVYRILLFAPFAASIAALACDIYYSYFRRAHDCASWVSNRPKDSVCVFYESLNGIGERMSVIGFEIIGLCLCFVILAYSLAALAYSKKLESLITRITDGGAQAI